MVSREAKLYVAKEIQQYQATKKEIMTIENMLHQEKVAVGGTATALVTHKTLQQMNNFVRSFEEVFERLPDEKQKMIQLLYWSNRDLNCNGVGMEIGVDGSTIGRWRMLVLTQIAERMGLK